MMKKTAEISPADLARLRRKMNQPKPGGIIRSELSLVGKKVTIVVDDDKLTEKFDNLKSILVAQDASSESEIMTYSIFMHHSGSLTSDIFILSNSSLFSKNERRTWICDALIDSRSANPDSAYVVYTQCDVIFQDLLDLVADGVVNAVENIGNRNDLALLKHASGLYEQVQVQ
jgi:hypothetical protein